MIKVIRVWDIDKEARAYMIKIAPIVNELCGGKYDWGKFDPWNYAVNKGRITLSVNAGKIRGICLASLGVSNFDNTTKMLYQDLLYAESPFGTSELLYDFIDFGRQNADHIVSMVASHTNIKPSSLKRLGFKEAETVYMLEV